MQGVSQTPVLGGLDGAVELLRNAGSQFDPDVVRAMMQVSLGKLRMVVGPLAWINELAWVIRVPETVSTAAVATAVSAGLSSSSWRVIPPSRASSSPSTG